MHSDPASDPVLKQPRGAIQNGEPERKSDVPECLRFCFDLRDELIVQDVLVFKGARLVVPTCMRRELMSVAHSTHIGIEGCLGRVREYPFWPRTASDTSLSVTFVWPIARLGLRNHSTENDPGLN